ncbi:Uncharacterized protein DAT39_019808 [Clarias magur]|uniref:Uncharacterized protein n=1 Tax=Clarias magur TaxID=1594786 RepID=A0A8J4U400_CLAMG|nr:Uncharacterized protein DAT39_019808 [Clarias magur]
MQPKTPLQEAVQQGVGHQSAQLVILSPWEQDSIASINLSKMRHHANTSPEMCNRRARLENAALQGHFFTP